MILTPAQYALLSSLTTGDATAVLGLVVMLGLVVVLGLVAVLVLAGVLAKAWDRHPDDPGLEGQDWNWEHQQH